MKVTIKVQIRRLRCSPQGLKGAVLHTASIFFRRSDLEMVNGEEVYKCSLKEFRKRSNHSEGKMSQPEYSRIKRKIWAFSPFCFCAAQIDFQRDGGFPQLLHLVCLFGRLIDTTTRHNAEWDTWCLEIRGLARLKGQHLTAQRDIHTHANTHTHTTAYSSASNI